MDWNPRKILGVADDLSTCSGLAATTGRRCGKRIGVRKVEAAEEILDEMSFHPLSATDSIDGFLADLAPCLLCSQWHEDQASVLVERWRTRILNVRKAEVTQEIQKSSKELEDITSKLARSSLQGRSPRPSRERTVTAGSTSSESQDDTFAREVTVRPLARTSHSNGCTEEDLREFPKGESPIQRPRAHCGGSENRGSSFDSLLSPELMLLLEYFSGRRSQRPTQDQRSYGFQSPCVGE